MRKTNAMGVSWKRAAKMAFALLFFAAALLSSRNYCFTWEEMHLNDLQFRPGPKTFSLDAGDQYGILSSGPDFSLRKGTYRISMAIDSDGENAVSIRSSNGARVEPAEIVIPVHSWNTDAEFTLLDDAENMEIQIEFRSGSYLAIHDITMSMPCTDRTWMVILCGLAVCILYLMKRSGYLTQERSKILLLLASAVFIASIPALRENLYGGHDAIFHYERLRNVVSGFESGQFPVRAGGHMYNGFGSVTSVFYPDYSLYIPALLMMAGTSVQFALSIYMIGLNMLSAVSMYLCAMRIFGDRKAGVCAAIFYEMAVYRLTDVYLRAAFGEAAAMAVLPLFILGIWEVVWGDKQRWMTLTLGATLVFHSHMITTVICAMLAVGACAMGIVPLIREKRIGALIKAALFTLLLNLFMLVPLLTYSAQGYGAQELAVSCAKHALEPVELFATSGFMKDIGIALILGVVVSGYSLIGCKGGKEKTAWVFLVLGLFAAVIATDYFPWDMLSAKTGGAVNYLQFPWRMMMFTDVFLALACGYGVLRLCSDSHKKEWMMLAVFALCTAAVFDQIGWYALSYDSAFSFWDSDSGSKAKYTEYTMPGSDLKATIEHNQVLADDGIALERYEKNGTTITAYAEAAQDGEILLPLFGHDGYRAQLDGKEIAWTLGENNRIAVALQAGMQGTLRVWFAGKPIWRIADAVSLCTLLTLIFAGAAGYTKRKRAAKGAK